MELVWIGLFLLTLRCPPMADFVLLVDAAFAVVAVAAAAAAAAAAIGAATTAIGAAIIEDAVIRLVAGNIYLSVHRS